MFNDAKFLPVDDDVGDVLMSLFGRNVVRLTEPFGEGIDGEVYHRLRLSPEPGGRFIQGQQASEVDGAQSLTHNHLFATHLAQHKSVLQFHNRLYIANKYLLIGRSHHHTFAPRRRQGV